MKSSIYKSLIVAIIFTCGIDSTAATPLSENAVRIPTQGNTFVTSAESSAPGYSEDDKAAVNIVGEIADWTNPATVISLYFKTSSAGKLNLYLNATAGDNAADKSTVKVTVGGKSRKVKIKGGALDDYNCGTFDIKAPGYVKVDLQGLSKSGATFAKVEGIAIDGDAAGGELHYSGIKDAGDAYWTRRGPSVHLNYALPDTDIEYFYNEVTVPEGSDVNGTYFMLTGFGEGYMGIQSIRRGEQNGNMVLFSVWSPYSTDNPEEIPDSLHVKVLATGNSVTAQNFGNEGSGKQSFMHYPWQPGKTYKTLVRVRPDGKGNTVYTGYFCDENGEWHLLSKLSRPRTDTWYRHPHSFLECFNPSLSFKPRRVEFANQWVRDSKGQWHEVTDASFSCDNTGRKGLRMDYNGGMTGNSFYLQNCGFVNGTTPYGSKFKRNGGGRRPEIDFDALDRLSTK